MKKKIKGTFESEPVQSPKICIKTEPEPDRARARSRAYGLGLSPSHLYKGVHKIHPTALQSVVGRHLDNADFKSPNAQKCISDASAELA